MAAITYDQAGFDVSDDISASHQAALAELGRVGTWLTADQRLAIASRARRAFAQRGTPPWSRELPEAEAGLDQQTVAIVDRIALDAGGIDRPWAIDAIAQLGDGPYVELIGVIATTVMIDMFAEAAGIDGAPFPQAETGTPTQQRPDGLGDIGAHVLMLEPFPFANVARALSLVPDTNSLFRSVMMPMYSAPGFGELVWDTPLSRPQVELVASRVAAMNDCFY